MQGLQLRSSLLHCSLSLFAALPGLPGGAIPAKIRAPNPASGGTAPAAAAAAIGLDVTAATVAAPTAASAASAVSASPSTSQPPAMAMAGTLNWATAAVLA